MDNTTSEVCHNQEFINNFNPNAVFEQNLNNQRINLVDLDSKTDIENLLDENTKNLVKKVYQSYQVLEVLKGF